MISGTAAVPTACGGFLLAVLWMDLMFDALAVPYLDPRLEMPEAALASIAAYYRRVTTTATPMGHLVGLVMMTAVASLMIDLFAGREPRWVALLSLALVGAPIALAAVRVVPNAVRLGARSDPLAVQASLARSICRDHLVCFASVLAFVALRLWAQSD